MQGRLGGERLLLQGVTVENGIIPSVNPVADIDVGGLSVFRFLSAGTGGLLDDFVDGQVSVAENEIVVILQAQLPVAEYDDVLFSVAEVFFVLPSVTPAAAVAPTQGDTETDAGVHDGEQPLVEAATEDAPQHQIVFVKTSDTVTMPDKESFAAKRHLHRVAVHDDAYLFLEVVEHPHIVVSDEIVYLYPFVGHLCQLAEKAYISARHYVFV